MQISGVSRAPFASMLGVVGHRPYSYADKNPLCICVVRWSLGIPRARIGMRPDKSCHTSLQAAQYLRSWDETWGCGTSSDHLSATCIRTKLVVHDWSIITGQVGNSQNYEPLLATDYITAPNSWGYQHGTLILRTNHVIHTGYRRTLLRLCKVP